MPAVPRATDAHGIQHAIESEPWSLSALAFESVPVRDYDLAPFRDVDAAVSLDGAPPELRAVELHEIVMRSDEGTIVTLARPRKDLLVDVALRDSLYALLALTTPVAVKLYLTIDGRKKPLRVELSVEGARDRLDFDRDDPAICTVVRGYLRARGVLRDAEIEDAAHVPSGTVRKAAMTTLVPARRPEETETEPPPFSITG